MTENECLATKDPSAEAQPPKLKFGISIFCCDEDVTTPTIHPVSMKSLLAPATFSVLEWWMERFTQTRTGQNSLNQVTPSAFYVQRCDLYLPLKSQTTNYCLLFENLPFEYIQRSVDFSQFGTILLVLAARHAMSPVICGERDERDRTGHKLPSLPPCGPSRAGHTVCATMFWAGPMAGGGPRIL